MFTCCILNARYVFYQRISRRPSPEIGFVFSLTAENAGIAEIGFVSSFLINRGFVGWRLAPPIPVHVSGTVGTLGLFCIIFPLCRISGQRSAIGFVFSTRLTG